MSIAENIAEIRQKIDAAARESGRSGDSITLVGASKTKTADACRAAIAAGIDALGENRVQEMIKKQEEHAYNGAPLHFIGHLQRNKVKQVVGCVDLIQSVGSEALLHEIEKIAAAKEIVQNILLEVNIAEEENKSGFAPQDISAAAEIALTLPHIHVDGLMAIPPADADRSTTLYYFNKVHAIYIDINEKMFHNSFQYLSMGMSGDYEDAIRAGASMVRIGGAIFGERYYPEKSSL